MADEKKTSTHKLILDKRENLSVTGVLDVISFDEEAIISETEMGVLIVKGLNLHVNKLNLEKGELEIDGQIISIMYEEETNFSKNKSSFLGKIFK